MKFADLMKMYKELDENEFKRQVCKFIFESLLKDTTNLPI